MKNKLNIKRVAIAISTSLVDNSYKKFGNISWLVSYTHTHGDKAKNRCLCVRCIRSAINDFLRNVFVYSYV